MLTLPGQLEHGLIGWWDMRAWPTGQTLRNGSRYGQAYDGALVANMPAAGAWVASRLGWVLSFDATDDAVPILGMAASTEHFTIAAWFKTSSSANMVLFAHGSSNPILDSLELRNSKVQWTKLGGTTILRTAATFNDDQWHLATLDTANDLIYMDGRLAAQQGGSGWRVSNQRVIGARYSGGAYSVNWDGLIGPVAIWNRPLAAGEAAELNRLTRVAIAPQRRRICVGLPVDGPYRVAAAQEFHTGAEAATDFVAAAVAGQALSSG